MGSISQLIGFSFRLGIAPTLVGELPNALLWVMHEAAAGPRLISLGRQDAGIR